jgi:hypothetical protein
MQQISEDSLTKILYVFIFSIYMLLLFSHHIMLCLINFMLGEDSNSEVLIK